ncbi:hypothetical protein ACSBR2_002793 [Camellia fascicularis]
MKLLEKQIFPDKSGTVKIFLEQPDDLWLVYNLIAVGDVITSQTSRKVNNKNQSRVNINLEIKVTAIDYSKGSSVLRVRGKNRVVNEHVHAGSFHTLELEKNKEFTLEKKVWDTKAMETMEDGHDGVVGYDLGVVLMEEGLAHVFLVGNNSVSKHCAKIVERVDPKTGLNKFFESVLCAFMKHIDWNMVRCAVIGSPGKIKAEFRQYILSEAQRSSKLKSIENKKSCILLANTNSGKENCLNEVLHNITVTNFIRDIKATVEIKAMKEFTDLLSSNSDRACYGLKSVEAAQELSAIKTLMITDELFKNAEIAMRKKYTGLIKSVKEARGKALVLSSMHVSGEELAKFTGIVAVLRFPMPEL